MKSHPKQSLQIMQKIDMYFDRHKLTPERYFIIGLALSSLLKLASDFWLILLPMLLGWLIWLGPRYLQRHNRAWITALGTAAYFVPQIVSALILWLGQPGWPLDGFTGGKYTDFRGLLAAVGIAIAVCCLLLLRHKLYDIVSIRRHSKKDLFQ